ncbi:alpha/beta fold hydrolase [Arhodomonas aquaeolei]|uniref:YheT family hydrolase n=1 Tax=Arhodomonas aquaeolei TaxID=2369 RepID=UPI00216A7969|nr:alpha/beta fold hydrolase [Arhodomonas aquaeolei]MCS4504012.1 alpha/beta fold hydrolase [Arhodomonas aquaeolei]
MIASPPPDDGFRPAPWLPGAHAQTIWPALCRPTPHVTLTRHPVTLPDGAVIHTYWGPERPGPLVLLLHGLGGDAGAPYCRGLVRALAAADFQAVVIEGRGTGGQPGRRFYHAGAWRDPAAVLARLPVADPRRTVHAVGISIGGSILLNWLAATGEDCPLASAVAVSTPFDLAACAANIDRGFARVYQAYLLNGLRRLLRRRARRNGAPVPALTGIRSLRAFDERITAPLHGFRNAADYYRRASTAGRLAAVTRPCLLIQAEDDPFVPASTIPTASALGPRTRLERQPRGGHVGFVGGPHPLAADYWLERRVPHWIAAASAIL